MGLPNLVLGGTVASLLYKSMGFSDTQIAFWTGIIILPWSFKPLWGPFMELYKTKRFYIYMSQMVCGFLFLLCLLSMYTQAFFGISVVLFLIIAFFGATQDIAADGLYLRELSPPLQARYVGWQGTFYNFAKLFSNGGMVFLAGVLIPAIGNTNAWSVVLAVYAAVMFLLGLYNRVALPATEAEKKGGSPAEVWATLKDVLISFFQKKYTQQHGGSWSHTVRAVSLCAFLAESRVARRRTRQLESLSLRPFCRQTSLSFWRAMGQNIFYADCLAVCSFRYSGCLPHEHAVCITYRVGLLPHGSAPEYASFLAGSTVFYFSAHCIR